MKSFLLRYVPILLWMSQIFGTSSHGNPADLLPRFVVRFTWNTTIFGQRLFFLLGPLGHMFNYGVLAFLAARAFAWDRPYDGRHAVLAFLVSFLYGVSDEVHQWFVPTRSFQVRDMVVNGLGALLGLGAYMIYDIVKAQRVREQSLLL
jgi:VanZ family protein